MVGDDRANVIGKGKREEIYELCDETHHDDERRSYFNEIAAVLVAMGHLPFLVEIHDERKHVQRDDNGQ